MQSVTLVQYTYQDLVRETIAFVRARVSICEYDDFDEWATDVRKAIKEFLVNKIAQCT